MKKKIAKKIANMAEKTAYNNVGKSSQIAVFEINPPAELIHRKKCDKS